MGGEYIFFLRFWKPSNFILVNSLNSNGSIFPIILASQAPVLAKPGTNSPYTLQMWRKARCSALFVRSVAHSMETMFHLSTSS